MIELTVAEKNSQAFLIIVFSFIKVFLSFESENNKNSCLRSLPIRLDLNKHISFNLDEQAILAASLLILRLWDQLKL